MMVVVWRRSYWDGLPFPRAGARSRVRVQVRFRPRVVSARRPHVPCRGLRCGPLSGPGPGSSPASRWSQPRGRRLPGGAFSASWLCSRICPAGASCTRRLRCGDCGTQTGQKPRGLRSLASCTTASLCLRALQTTQAGWWRRSPCTAAHPGRRPSSARSGPCQSQRGASCWSPSSAASSSTAR